MRPHGALGCGDLIDVGGTRILWLCSTNHLIEANHVLTPMLQVSSAQTNPQLRTGACFRQSCLSHDKVKNWFNRR